MQNKQLCFWAVVNPGDKETVREFMVVGTGHNFASTFDHVGTVQDPPFVWHLLELI